MEETITHGLGTYTNHRTQSKYKYAYVPYRQHMGVTYQEDLTPIKATTGHDPNKDKQRSISLKHGQSNRKTTRSYNRSGDGRARTVYFGSKGRGLPSTSSSQEVLLNSWPAPSSHVSTPALARDARLRTSWLHRRWSRQRIQPYSLIPERSRSGIKHKSPNRVWCPGGFSHVVKAKEGGEQETSLL